MATIEKATLKNGKASYRVKVRLSGFPQKSASFDKKGDAKGWASKVETEMLSGRHRYELSGEKRTLGELIVKYMETVLESKTTKARYIANQRPQLLWWNGRIGSCSLSNITPAIIGQCRDELFVGKGGKKRAAGTVNRYLSALSHVLSTAVKEWGWMEHNPMASVRKPIEARGRVRFLSDKEREALLSACKREKRKPLYLIVVMAISTGARKMELLSLKWRDVDFKRMCITVHETKNGERRSLFLSGLALELLTAYAKYRPRQGYVFASRISNQPINIEHQWKRAVAKAGLVDFRFHDLRHTTASYLAMNGASIPEIAEVLGHKTLNMVKRYAHLSTTHTAKVVASMNDKVFGQQEQRA